MAMAPAPHARSNHTIAGITPGAAMIAKFTALAMLVCAATAFGQQANPPAFQLEGLLPAGPRTSATESWGTLRFELANSTDAARDARVVVFYPEHPASFAEA